MVSRSWGTRGERRSRNQSIHRAARCCCKCRAGAPPLRLPYVSRAARRKLAHCAPRSLAPCVHASEREELAWACVGPCCGGNERPQRVAGSSLTDNNEDG
eukprot:scaffold746_cov508-Prasinococcus_capsulatus_cf.AAC.12